MWRQDRFTLLHLAHKIRKYRITSHSDKGILREEGTPSHILRSSFAIWIITLACTLELAWPCFSFNQSSTRMPKESFQCVNPKVHCPRLKPSIDSLYHQDKIHTSMTLKVHYDQASFHLFLLSCLLPVIQIYTKHCVSLTHTILIEPYSLFKLS